MCLSQNLPKLLIDKSKNTDSQASNRSNTNWKELLSYQEWRYGLLGIISWQYGRKEILFVIGLSCYSSTQPPLWCCDAMPKRVGFKTFFRVVDAMTHDWIFIDKKCHDEDDLDWTGTCMGPLCAHACHPLSYMCMTTLIWLRCETLRKK